MNAQDSVPTFLPGSKASARKSDFSADLSLIVVHNKRNERNAYFTKRFSGVSTVSLLVIYDIRKGIDDKFEWSGWFWTNYSSCRTDKLTHRISCNFPYSSYISLNLFLTPASYRCRNNPIY